MGCLNNEILQLANDYANHSKYNPNYKKVIADLIKKCDVLEEGNLFDHLTKQIEEKRKLFYLNEEIKEIYGKQHVQIILNKYFNKNNLLKRLSINNLGMGSKYNVYQISSLINNFNTDVGMYVDSGKKFVVIKSTLHKSGQKISGRGRYQNKLLENGDLKYYCESDKNSYSFKNTKPNNLLKDSINMITPVNTYVFFNEKKGDLYKYAGVFYPTELHKDAGGYYFVLAHLSDNKEIELLRYSNLIEDFESNYNISKDPEKSEDIRYLAEVMMRNTNVQKEFKKNLMNCQKKCALCDISYKPLLIASHIKPLHAIAKSNDTKLVKYKEATDKKNGLLLCNIHDSLFDKGYISFDKLGNLLVSKFVPQEIQAKHLFVESIEKDIFDEMYMKYHRNKVFKK